MEPVRAYPPPLGHEHRILDHGALAVEQHGFPFGIGQAQIAFFPDAGVEHGLKRIEGGAEMLPEAAPAPFVVGQPLGIGRGAEAASVAVAPKAVSSNSELPKPRWMERMPLASIVRHKAMNLLKSYGTFQPFSSKRIVYDVPHLRRAGQAIEFAVAGYTVEHGGVVPAGERHTRKIEQAAGCSESG